MRIRLFWLVGLCLWGWGCGSSSNGTAVDAQTVDAFYSICGHPGDQGNSLGVGKFCTTIDDCGSNSEATICSSLGNDPADPSMNSFFCTFECAAGSGSNVCGSGASCQCSDAGCGCAPDSCGSAI